MTRDKTDCVAAYLTDTADYIREHGDGDDLTAQAIANLLQTVARTLATAPPDVLYDYQPTANAALHLARAYLHWAPGGPAPLEAPSVRPQGSPE